MNLEVLSVGHKPNKRFLLYSNVTKGGGATITSTSSGGGTSRSTNSGGGSTQTSSGGGNHRHVMFQTGGDTGASGSHIQATGNGGASIVLGPGTDRMSNIETLSASGSHTHSVNIPNHSHEFSTPNHTHDVNLPAHTHEVEHGIYELDRLPSEINIKVDGNEVPHTALEMDRLDLIPYMSKDDNGKISRGRHEVEILPDDLARIEADLILRVFIQSHLGGTY